MKNFNTMADDHYHTSQSNLGDRQQQQSSSTNALSGGQQVVDEMSQDLTYLSREAPLDGGESTLGATSYSQLAGSHRDESVLHMGNDLPDEDELERRRLESPVGFVHDEQALNQLSPDNVDIQKPLQQAGPLERQPFAANDESSLPLKPFLVSFMVDARGGAMRGCRHSGVRVIIPPNSAQMPMRITCRYLRRERLVHPPPLMEGEACASKIMEVGPAGAKFLGPVLIEVPHFASLRGKEREIIILRSDTGEIWREHLVEADERLLESIIKSAASSSAADDQENVRPASAGGAVASGSGSGSGGDAERQTRLTRIVTNEFPQYFAIISRIRQEVHAVGPDGTTVNSQVVPRVQAIFTEGALTKRIKIGLQPKSTKKDTNQAATAQDNQAIDSSDETQQQQHSISSSSPTHQQDLGGEDRAVSPASNQTQGSQTRPGSTGAAKRRSRLLACFGARQGSADLLNSGTDESSAGGESPPQPCNEKLVTRRHILGDVTPPINGDSDGETRSSPSPSSLSGGDRSIRVKRHVVKRELVPADYYMDKEPPLILNIEPTTYGKRLASSSAQTDSKLHPNGYLSTSAKKTSKRRGLLPGRRKHKTQMTIHCDAAPTRPKSALGSGGDAAADSSLETVDGQQQQQDDISIIQDVITSDDQKWRTCTIQTDSDSVTVNYVTISGEPQSAQNGGGAGKSAPTAGQDDGYVSGSGDLKKEGSFGKGLFGLSSAFGGADKHQLAAAAAAEETKRKKKGAKKAEKKAAKRVEASAAKDESSGGVVVELSAGESAPTAAKLAADESLTDTNEEQQQVAAARVSLEQQQDETGKQQQARSVSPSNKELKQKLKLERQEKLKREKEEKRHLKELEEAAAKAEKQKRKEEKKAKKAEKVAQKQQAKSASPTSKPQTPLPAGDEPTTAPTKTASVTFASTLVETSLSPAIAEVDQAQHQAARQLDSIQRVIESTKADYEREKGRLSQEDGHDMVQVSISERVGGDSEQPLSLAAAGEPKTARDEEKLISFSDSEDPSKSIELELNYKLPQQQQQQSESIHVSEQQQTNLKPILKQQSTVSSADEASAELVISTERKLTSGLAAGQPLVSEASAEAVRIADELKAAGGSPQSPSLGSLSPSKKELAKEAKEEKERLKREAKDKLEEEKRAAKEAKRLAKEAEAAKKAEERAAKKEAERLAKEARIEQERLAKEAKAEQERLAKEAKEAKKKLKLEKKQSAKQQQVQDGGEPSAPPAELVVEKSLDESTTVTSSEEPVVVSVEAPKEQQRVAGSGTIELVTVEKTVEVVEPKVDKKAEEAKKKAAKKADKKRKTAEAADVSESTEPASSATTASKSSFLSRLFGGKGRSSKSDVAGQQSGAEQTASGLDDDEARRKLSSRKKQTAAEDKPVILSEMYPTDPNDADGEMILEVNVPENLIDKSGSLAKVAQTAEFSQASDTAPSQTLGTATTIDESFRTSERGLPQQGAAEADDAHVQSAHTTTVGAGADHDDQATLVNLSQMVTSEAEEDEEATENVVSQANDDLAQEGIPAESPTAASGVVVAERKKSALTLQLSQGQEQELVTAATVETATAAKSKSELDDEKKRKELEGKLEKEAKKRAKEEEKAAKKREKEEKAKAKLEAKKEAKEEKKRAEAEAKKKKEEAKEAKRLADLAKKQAKKDKKTKTKEIKEGEEAPAAAAAASTSAAATSSEREAEAAAAAVEAELIETDNMTPVNTETEVERIVEEVVDEDGVVTKTTKTIETKYVTLRQEEVRVNEHREMPVEEYERELLAQQRKSSTSSSLSSLARQQQRQQAAAAEVPTQAKRRSTLQAIVVGPYEHAELDEIRATPSYFGAECPVEIEPEISPKKAMKKRVKLNQKLIKRAHKLAQSELKKAKKGARAAEAEIAVCDEAAKQAQKELRHAMREAKRAAKLAAKEHKRMDKMDKKLAKNQKKIEKRQEKIDKESAKLAKKAAKKEEKAAKKRAKLENKRQSSQRSTGSSGSKKSIRLEDIGDPVLRSSSRLSIGGGQATLEVSGPDGTGSEMVMVSSDGTVIERRASPASDDILQVEMSLDDSRTQQQQQRQDSPTPLPEAQEEAHRRRQRGVSSSSSSSEQQQELAHRTITSTISSELPAEGKQVSEEVRREVLVEEAYEAEEAPASGDQQQPAGSADDHRPRTTSSESDEEIDVVNELPDFSSGSGSRSEKRQAELAD